MDKEVPINTTMKDKLDNAQKPGDTRNLIAQLPTSKKTRFGFHLVGVALGLTAVALGVLLFWAFTGQDVLVVSPKPIDVQPVVVKSEDTLTVSVNYCKKNGAQGTVYTRFVSSKTELVVPAFTDNTATGCYKNYHIKVPVPPQMPPGYYQLKYKVVYETNPITTVTEEFNTIRFEVIP